MEKKFPEDFGLQSKPDDVDIKAISQDGGTVLGLGTDNNVYRWWEKHNQWTIRSISKPTS